MNGMYWDREGQGKRMRGKENVTRTWERNGVKEEAVERKAVGIEGGESIGRGKQRRWVTRAFLFILF